MHGPTLVSDIAVVLSVAALTSLLFRKLGQPTVLGYLLAGLIVGPYLPIPIFADHTRIEALSELGVVLVMFGVGLEFRVRKLVRILPTAGLTCALQVGALIWGGITLGGLFGWGPVASTFLGTSVAISSTMVVSKVLEQRPIDGPARELVFGVLILQDLVAIGLIATMTAVAAGGGLETKALILTVGRLAAVLIALVAGGLFVVPRLVKAAVRQKSPETMVVVLGGICFSLALLAEELGYSVALGAFIAGILVAEAGQGQRTEHLFQPLRDTFAAVFFVSIGMTIDPRLAIDYAPASLAVFLLVVVGQLVSVTVGALLAGNGLRKAITAAIALGQVGEFAFILTGIGVAAGVVPESLLPILVTVAVLTAFTTPLLLGRAEKVIRVVDHVLPARLHEVLALYAAWLEQLRRPNAEGSAARSQAMRVLRVLVVDAIAVTGVVAAGSVWFERMAETVLHLGIHRPYHRAAVGGALALVALPFFVGFLRNTRLLGRLAGESFLSAGAQTSPGAEALRRSLILLVEIVVVLAISVPAVAFLRPFLPGPYAAPVAAIALIIMGFLLWRRLEASHAGLRSGAERVLEVLTLQTDEEVPRPPVKDEIAVPGRTGSRMSVLPGLGPVLAVRLDEAAYAVGRTLAELDLRARTEANVLAIHRSGADVLIPTGVERLQALDVLALAGAERARARGEEYLLHGPPVETPAEPERVDVSGEVSGEGSAVDYPS